MAEIPHLAAHGDAVQLVVDGAPFIVLGGQVHNSSSSSLAYMERVWERIVELECNTAITPVYWELVEPAEGVYDFALVDGLVAAARARGLRLILLWFATWKNANSTYAPEWVKTDLDRFRRAEREPGRPCDAISSTSDAACRADGAALAALMRHLRLTDERERTVLMIQVENETGLLGASRDRCPEAEASFAGPVPRELVEHLERHESALRPELRALWRAAGDRTSGTWSELFETGADEVFMAWHVARYVQRVASAGHAEYALPLYVNAWLVQSEGQRPGQYPSGGPVSRMMDVWRCAAPDIFTLAPDIYLPCFASVCADYRRADNPLLIPEASRETALGAKCLYAVGRHDALGFAPFGIDSIDSPDAVYVDGPVADGSVKRGAHGAGKVLARTYRIVRNMMPVVAAHQGTGSMTAFLQGADQVEVAAFGGYRLRIEYAEHLRDGSTPGGALVVNPSPGEYVVAGLRCRIDIIPAEGGRRRVEFLSLDEGEYRDGRWVPGRRLNGDEHAIRLGELPGVMRARVHSFD